MYSYWAAVLTDASEPLRHVVQHLQCHDWVGDSEFRSASIYANSRMRIFEEAGVLGEAALDAAADVLAKFENLRVRD